MKRIRITGLVAGLIMALVAPVLCVMPVQAQTDHSFTYIITASGTEDVQEYAGIQFDWKVEVVGMEDWTQERDKDHRVKLQGDGHHARTYGDGVHKITSVNFVPDTQVGIGGWDQTPVYNTDQTRVTLNFQLNYNWTNLTPFLSGTVHIEYEVPRQTEVRRVVASGTDTVHHDDGNKRIGEYNVILLPSPQHGGVLDTSTLTHVLTCTEDAHVTLSDGPQKGPFSVFRNVYASTNYTETVTKAWSKQKSDSGSVSDTEGTKEICTSTLAAPNGDTTWSVTDDSPNVDTWMDDNVLMARAVNQAPVAVGDAYVVAEDGTLAVTAPGVLGNDGDADGDSLTADLVNDVSNGTLSFNSNGSFGYTPEANFSGTDTFTYRANDGTTHSNTATVTITVVADPDGPLAVDDAYITDENGTLDVEAPGVLANDYDYDGDSLTALLQSTVSNGTLSFNSDGSFTYMPNADFSGTDTFTYRVNDGTADSNVATVTITVNLVENGDPVPDPEDPIPGDPAPDPEAPIPDDPIETTDDSDGAGFPAWAWVLLALGTILAGIIAILLARRQSSQDETPEYHDEQ